MKPICGHSAAVASVSVSIATLRNARGGGVTALANVVGAEIHLVDEVEAVISRPQIHPLVGVVRVAKDVAVIASRVRRR